MIDAMSYETIDMQEAVKQFHHLMQPSHKMRVLRLEGEEKMGKSHLLIYVFPMLAREYQAKHVLLDLRNHTDTIPNFLCLAKSQLDLQTSHFDAAYQAWLNRPKFEAEQLLALFSRVTISVEDSQDDLSQRDLHLTTQFIQDLRTVDDRPLLFLFDSVERASLYVQTWLMNTFMVQLSPLHHVRVVVAGRSLPEAYCSYATSCQSYKLSAVRQMGAYTMYCRTANLPLSEPQIEALAQVFRYTPGLFVEWVVPTEWAMPTFMSEEEDLL